MKLTSIVEGLVLGAGLMYVLDPEGGRRRRAHARDQFQKQIRTKQEALAVMQRDFMNRSRGLVTQLKTVRSQGDMASDEIIEARVRSALGRVCSHSHAIHTEVGNGHVTLTGPVLANEVERICQSVSGTKGVNGVINNLDVIADPSHVPSLQGGGHLPEPSMMNPAMGLVLVSAGGLLTAYGVLRRGVMGTVYGAAGISMITKAFRDTEGRYTSRSNNMEEPLTPKQEASMEGFEGMNLHDSGATNQISAMPVAADDNAGMV